MCWFARGCWKTWEGLGRRRLVYITCPLLSLSPYFLPFLTPELSIMTLIFSRMCMLHHEIVLQNTSTTHLLTSTPFCLNSDLSNWCKAIMNTIGQVLIARFFWLQIASFCPQLKITVKGLLNEYYTYHTTSACQSLIDRAPIHSHTFRLHTGDSAIAKAEPPVCNLNFEIQNDLDLWLLHLLFCSTVMEGQNLYPCTQLDSETDS